VARARADDEVEGQDEEFLFHLNRGAELLSRGEAAAAASSLDRALELRPRDSKALGLLGQAHYKLGRYDLAVEAYARLVDENPVEAAARVNLGLASLKAGRRAEAVKQLQVALDLAPGHKRAMGYLGLALLESGDAARARDWFVRAGSEPMVARCDDLLAQRGGQTPEALAAQARALAPTPIPSASPLGQATPVPAPSPLPAAAPAAATPVPLPEPTRAAALADAVSPAAALRGTPTLAALAEARLVTPEALETFAVSKGLLTVAIHGELLVRGRGLAAVRGSVRLAPEMKRFRGRATDKPFGEGADQMLRASGEGALLFPAGDRRLTSVALDGEAGYFREEAVFGFEDQLAFENGRVASRLGADLNLVHLRGRGRLLLATAGELVAIPASADVPVRVPLAALAGWAGSLTPRLVPLLEGAEGPGPVPLGVELAGEGRVLLDPDAARPAAAAP